MTNTNKNTDEIFGDFSSYEGKPVTQLNIIRVQAYNAYAGNAKELRDGGFGVPLKQADDADSLFQIGPKVTMKPQRGDPYDVFAASELEVAIVGTTGRYSVVYEGGIVGEKQNRRVPLPNRAWVKVRDADGKSVTTTENIIYFIFKNDPERRIHSMNLTGTRSQFGVNLINAATQLTQDYQRLARQHGKEITLPGMHVFWLKVGVGEPVSVSNADGDKQAFVVPPVLTWRDGKRPKTVEDFKIYYVGQKAYDELSLIAKEVDAFVNSNISPRAVGKLSEEFQRITGYTQLPDGTVAVAGALPSGVTSSTPMLQSANGKADPANAPTLMFAQWLTKPGNTMESLDAMLRSYGTSISSIIEAYEVDDIRKINSSIQDTIYVITA
jgi:hypothetical protein